MNIRTNQVDALLRQGEQTAPKTTGNTDDGFEAALAAEMESASNAPASPPLSATGTRSALIGQMLLAEAEKISTSPEAGQAVRQTIEQASGALDMWESYVGVLGGPEAAGNTLRAAYGLLDGLDARVTALKEEAQPVLGRHPGLADLIEEMQVMTAAEKFKLNRGDYS